MAEKTIEIEAESLEEAKEQVKSQTPKGFCALSEQVIADGRPGPLTKRLLEVYRERADRVTRSALASA